MESELLHYWIDKPVEGYHAEDESIVKIPLDNVEDALFAYIMSLTF